MNEIQGMLKKNVAEIFIVLGLAILYYLKHTKPKFSDTNFIMYAGAMIFSYYLYKNQVTEDLASNIAAQKPTVTASGLPPFK